MASGTIEKILKSEVVSLGTITIRSDGYLDISSYRPNNINVLFCEIESWGTVSPVGAINITRNGQFIMGPSSAKITSLSIRYYYQ
jgi:hypothetical protein